MATVTGINNLIAAQLSNAAYGLDLAGPQYQAPGNWFDLSAYADRSTLLDDSYRVYVDYDTHELVIAFKGTDNLLNFASDLYDDGGSAWESLAGKVGVTIGRLKNDFPGWTIYTDGHSLGGGMAQTAALEYNLSGFGQNSLPISLVAQTDDIQLKNKNLVEINREWATTHFFDEFNTAGDIATTHYLGGFYISTVTTPVPNRYAAIQAWALEQIAQTKSPEVVRYATVVSAIASLYAHSLHTVIDGELSNRSLQLNPELNQILDTSSVIEQAVKATPFNFGDGGSLLATDSIGNHIGLSLAGYTNHFASFSINTNGLTLEKLVIFSDGAHTVLNTDIEPGAAITQGNDTFATASSSVTFLGGNGSLQIADPAAFSSTIFDFLPGDRLDFETVSPSHLTFDPSKGVFNLQDNQGSYNTIELDPSQAYAFSYASPKYNVAISDDGAGGSQVAMTSVAYENKTFVYAGPTFTSGVSNGQVQFEPGKVSATVTFSRMPADFTGTCTLYNSGDVEITAWSIGVYGETLNSTTAGYFPSLLMNFRFVDGQIQDWLIHTTIDVLDGLDDWALSTGDSSLDPYHGTAVALGDTGKDSLQKANGAVGAVGTWSLESSSVFTWPTPTQTLTATDSNQVFTALAGSASDYDLSIDPTGDVVLQSQSETSDLVGYSAFVFADSAVTQSGNTLTAENSDGSRSVSDFNVTGQVYTRSAYDYDASGQLVAATYSGTSGLPFSSFTTEYAGSRIADTQYVYTGITGQIYTTETLRVNAAGQQTAVSFGGVTGRPFSAYAYDYANGLFAGSRFTYTTVPGGAGYSSVETDFDFGSTYVGAKFVYANIAGQDYTGEEIDTTPAGVIQRVVLTGYVGQPYQTLELDYTASTYAGCKTVATGITGQGYTGLETDVTAAGQLTKLVYTGLKATPYTTLEQDFAGGALTGSIFTFNAPAGQSYTSYTVTQNALGAQISETIDNSNGSHTILGSAPNLIFALIGNDTITGGGSGETFGFGNVFGHDTITDFHQFANGAGHDTIDLSTADFGSFAALSASAQNVTGGVMFTGRSNSSITLPGIDKATLATLGADFKFHA